MKALALLMLSIGLLPAGCGRRLPAETGGDAAPGGTAGGTAGTGGASGRGTEDAGTDGATAGAAGGTAGAAGGRAGSGGSAGSAGAGGAAGAAGGASGASGIAGATAGTAGATAGAAGSSAGGSSGSGGGGDAGTGGAPARACVTAWPMPNASIPVAAAPPLPNPASYDTSAADVVVDNVTGLEWQRMPPATAFMQSDAAAYCAGLDLGGHHDWRLPTRIELVSILDLRQSSPGIDGDAFPNTERALFWTSTIISTVTTSTWVVDFGLSEPKTAYAFSATAAARCVRAPAPTTFSQPCYTVDGETVRDNYTKLTWQRTAAAATYDWDGAQQYCAALDLDGTGWRVPTPKELLTILSDAVATGRLDPTAFTAPDSRTFWTQSVLKNQIGGGIHAWEMDFSLGITGPQYTTVKYAVRCVR